MSDRFDQQLKHSIKEATARSLDGWEFSPQMRQAVHERIAQEAALPATPVPAFRTRPILKRPITWVAAAAAVLVVSFAMLPKMEELIRGQRDSQGAESMAAQADMAMQPRLMAAPASPEVAARPGESLTSATPPQAKAAVQSGAPPLEPGKGNAEMATQLSALDASTGSTLSSEQLIDAMGNRGAPARTYLIAPASVVSTRGVPDAPETPEVGIFTMAASPISVDLVPLPGGQFAVTTSFSLQVHDEAGAVIAEEPLADWPDGLRTGPDGRIGVLSGTKLDLFTPAGTPDGELKLELSPAAVALGPAGRVATLDDQGLVLYQGERPVKRISGLDNGLLAFAADGTLAHFAQAGEGRTLHVLGPEGSQLADVDVTSGGEGLTFAADGQYVVTGSQVYHRSGQPAWQISFQPVGVTSLGPSGPVLAWDQHQVSLLQAEDGLEQWTAEYQGGRILQVAAAADGQQLAVLGELDGGEAAVWVLGRDGGQRYAERLATVPLRVAVAGASLHLLMPDGVEVRQLAEP